GGLTNHAPGNVDVLSVRTVSNKVFEHKTDVRFAVHGSPYLQAWHLNWLLTSHPDELREVLRLDRDVGIEMIGVSECVEESVCDASCLTLVHATTRGYLVGSNRTTLLAVDTWSEPYCSCQLPPLTASASDPCYPNPCRNGGVCKLADVDYKCQCPDGFRGPNCELMELSFTSGSGYALMNSLPACNDTEIVVDVL
ncbi:unnamed protein product, partial [Notodromas monacha]